MAAVGAYLEKAMLDWSLLGATPTRPGTVALGLATVAPTSLSPFEIATGSGYTRSQLTMSPAVSPAGSVVNSVALTYGPFSSAQSISGVAVFDTVLSMGSGNLLYYGLLSTARTVGPGDQLVIAAGALTITMA